MSAAITPPYAIFEPSLGQLDMLLKGIRTGRASTGLVDQLSVEAYGSTMKIRDVASVSTPDAKTIQIEPWDKSLLSVISKAIETSTLSLNPVVAGSIIRLVLPPLTEERRLELAKLVREHVEEVRSSVRSQREKLLKDVQSREKQGEISEDEAERERKNIQGAVERITREIEARREAKENEIRSVGGT